MAETMVMTADVKEPEVKTYQYYGCLPVNKVLGFDISQWQSKTTEPKIHVDFKKMKAGGGEFVYIRERCKGINDTEWAYSWKAAQDAGLLVGAYVAIDYRANLQSQIEKSVYRLIDTQGQLPLAVDFEKLLYQGLGPKKALANLEYIVKGFDSIFGKKCIIYTNPDAIKNFIGWLPAWFLEHDLWIAHYGVDMVGPEVGYQYFTKVGLPKGGFRFWQSTDRADGIKFGCVSKQVDLTWFNGTRADLLAYAGKPPEPPDLPKTLEERVTALEAWVKAH